MLIGSLSDVAGLVAIAPVESVSPASPSPLTNYVTVDSSPAVLSQLLRDPSALKAAGSTPFLGSDGMWRTPCQPGRHSGHSASPRTHGSPVKCSITEQTDQLAGSKLCHWRPVRRIHGADERRSGSKQVEAQQGIPSAKTALP